MSDTYTYENNCNNDNNTEDKRSISYSVSLSSERNKRYDIMNNDNNNNCSKCNWKYQLVNKDNNSYSNNNSNSNNNSESFSNQKLNSLERDREFLIQKNKDLEENISRLEKIIDTQFQITQPRNNTYDSYPKANYSSVMSTISSFPSKKSMSPRSQQRMKTIQGSKSKSKSGSKKRTTTPIKSKLKYVNDKEREKEERRSRILKNKVDELQKRVEHLKEELKLNMLENKGESYLLYEVDKWQKRTNIIGKDYIENLSLIKKKLFNDKIDYQTEIKKIENICAFQLAKLKENCDGLINKQNYTIEGYIKNNTDLRRRLDKLKNVFAK